MTDQRRDESLTELVVPEGGPMRLDLFLARRLGLPSRQAARDLVERSVVTINGRRAAKGHLVHAHDRIRIKDPAEPLVEPAAEPDLPVGLLFEDEAVVAVDKPPGMPSVAIDVADRGTVSNYLLGRHPEMAKAGPNAREAGLVHRLDTATSGVLLAARTPDAYRELRAQFREAAVEKEYLALVVGEVTAAGAVETPIAHMPRHPRRMTACDTPEKAAALGARPARTAYRPIAQAAGKTLLLVRIRTGVRHQVRVHLASIGHPIIGDPLYPRPPAEGTRTQRLLLHALRIAFRHPSTGRLVTVEAPAPPELTLRGETRRQDPPARSGRNRAARAGRPTPRHRL